MKDFKATASLLFALAAGSLVLAQNVQRPRLAGEDFQKRFKESYIAVSSREPQVTQLEKEILDKLATMIESNPTYAKTFLADILGDDKPVSAAFNHALGNLYYESGDFLQAEIEYSKAIVKHETFQRAWNGLGLARYQQNDYDGAIEALSQSVRLGASDSLTYGLLGYCHLQKGNYRSSETAYNLATLNDAENMDWAEGMAQIYMETGRYEEAIGIFDEMIRKDPDNIDAWLLKANAWLSLDEPMKTARCIEIARRIGDVDTDTLYLLGNIYLKEGVFDNARSIFLTAIRDRGEIDEHEALQATRFLMLNDEYEMAQQIFGYITEEGEDWSESNKSLYQYLSGEFAFDKGNYQAAREAFVKALEYDPFNGRILLQLADIHAMNDEVEEAIIYFDRAAFDPKAQYAALVNKSMLLINKKQYEQAMKPLEEAMELRDDPKLVKLHAQVKRVVDDEADIVRVQ